MTNPINVVPKSDNDGSKLGRETRRWAEGHILSVKSDVLKLSNKALAPNDTANSVYVLNNQLYFGDSVINGGNGGGGGLTEQQVNTIVDTAIGGLDLITEQQVNTIVDTAIDGLDLITEQQVNTIVDTAIDGLDLITEQQVIDLVGSSPVSQRSINNILLTDSMTLPTLRLKWTEEYSNRFKNVLLAPAAASRFKKFLELCDLLHTTQPEAWATSAPVQIAISYLKGSLINNNELFVDELSTNWFIDPANPTNLKGIRALGIFFSQFQMAEALSPKVKGIRSMLSPIFFEHLNSSSNNDGGLSNTGPILYKTLNPSLFDLSNGTLNVGKGYYVGIDPAQEISGTFFDALDNPEFITSLDLVQAPYILGPDNKPGFYRVIADGESIDPNDPNINTEPVPFTQVIYVNDQFYNNYYKSDDPTESDFLLLEQYTRYCLTNYLNVEFRTSSNSSSPVVNVVDKTSGNIVYPQEVLSILLSSYLPPNVNSIPTTKFSILAGRPRGSGVSMLADYIDINIGEENGNLSYVSSALSLLDITDSNINTFRGPLFDTVIMMLTMAIGSAYSATLNIKHPKDVNLVEGYDLLIDSGTMSENYVKQLSYRDSYTSISSMGVLNYRGYNTTTLGDETFNYYSKKITDSIMYLDADFATYGDYFLSYASGVDGNWLSISILAKPSSTIPKITMNGNNTTSVGTETILDPSKFISLAGVPEANRQVLVLRADLTPPIYLNTNYVDVTELGILNGQGIVYGAFNTYIVSKVSSPPGPLTTQVLTIRVPLVYGANFYNGAEITVMNLIPDAAHYTVRVQFDVYVQMGTDGKWFKTPLYNAGRMSLQNENIVNNDNALITCTNQTTMVFKCSAVGYTSQNFPFCCGIPITKVAITQ